METIDRADIHTLEEGFDAIERDARALVAGVDEAHGTWRPAPDAWSIAHCLDHLAIGNRVYVRAMQPAAERALAAGRRRWRPARPGVIGGWFVGTLEPPVKPLFKGTAPEKIRPRRSPAWLDAIGQFFASHDEVRRFLQRYADIDLPGVRFPNPFIRGVRFSLATGLHVIAAHERRHIWQAWRVRRASEADQP
jgi:DinB superfamily